MKFECPHCSSLVEPENLNIEGKTVHWACPICGEQVTLEEKGKSPEKGNGKKNNAEEADNHSEKCCPKCGALRKGRGSCPKCGLVFSRWKDSPEQDEKHEILDPLWEAVEGDFSSKQAHDAFIKEALMLNRLDLAAFRYSKYRDNHPTKRQSVEVYLERLASMAQFQVLGSEEKKKRKTDHNRYSGTKKKILWIVLVVVLIFFVYLAFFWDPKPIAKKGRDSNFRPGSSPVNLKNKAKKTTNSH